MPSNVKPVSVKVIYDSPHHPDVTAIVEKINADLVLAWTQLEADRGRWLDPQSASAEERAEVFRLFRKAGWTVDLEMSPRNESYWKFVPKRVRQPYTPAL